MLSVGLCVAGRFDGESYDRRKPTEHALYMELKPITENFVPEALAVSDLDRDRLALSGSEPVVAMKRVSKWIDEVSGGDRPVICAYPAAFDWLFLYWYLENFAAEENPVGFSSCLD